MNALATNSGQLGQSFQWGDRDSETKYCQLQPIIGKVQ